MEGLEFIVMKRKGKCNQCKCEILSGSKSVVIGSYTNEYRYCIDCFIKTIENEFDVEILDFVNQENHNGN